MFTFEGDYFMQQGLSYLCFKWLVHIEWFPKKKMPLTLYNQLSFYAALKITKTSIFHYFKIVYLSGFLDSQEWLAHFDDGNNSLHKRSESARRSSERYRLDRLELGHRERGRRRFRSLRMPDQHRAKKE